MAAGRTDRIPRLAIAVTFHYVESRLQYLKTISAQFHRLADDVSVHIVTNSANPKHRDLIVDVMEAAAVPYKVIVPPLLGHPFLLTWTHLAVFRHLVATVPAITHYMYLEDDILIRPENIRYWLEGREILRSTVFYPSFLRYEVRENGGPAYCSDAPEAVDPSHINKIVANSYYAFLNHPRPYQGMYLLDREQMIEHLEGTTSHPDSNTLWFIREKAAQGLTFGTAPDGYTSRNLLGYRIDKGRVDERALIHHVPNNYATMPGTTFGKLPVADLISPRFRP